MAKLSSDLRERERAQWERLKAEFIDVAHLAMMR